jgi:hypothetical protein
VESSRAKFAVHRFSYLCVMSKKRENYILFALNSSTFFDFGLARVGPFWATKREVEKKDARFDRALLALLPLRPREGGRGRLPANLQRERERTEHPPAATGKEKEREKGFEL